MDAHELKHIENNIIDLYFRGLTDRIYNHCDVN